MQRVLDPAQIESFAQRQIPRVRLADPARVFAARAERLRALADGNPVGDYLNLMGVVCDAQQEQLTAHRAGGLPAALLPAVRLARQHGMPPLPALGLDRGPLWREILTQLCGAVGRAEGFPAPVATAVRELALLPVEVLERQAEALLAAQEDGVEPAAAPFVMAALQVCWTLRVSQLPVGDLVSLTEVGTVCPLCGSLPVASIVHGDKEYAGYRYLSCALCGTEWHMVRVKCSHCLSTAGIHYDSIEGGPQAIRAEACEQCHTYRKIFYREHDSGVEAVADDLASLTLDLLMADGGYQRANGNPLLWQPTT